MKQLLFLLLFPCLAMAQYTGNAGQKITLGEQTTADGLVYRGVENDTALITPLSDTSAYIILDTVNNKFYNYNRATNVWSVAGGGVSVSSFSAGTTGFTPSTATSGAVTLSGTLAVANGGTGITSLGTGVATFLGTPSSANLASAVTNETGSDNLVFATQPVFTNTIGIGAATASTSGSGITFPATQAASTNVNTLDDYEEGTFTPSWVSSGATFVYDASYRHGRYTKIGNTVYVSFHISTTEIPGGTITNALTISGMPFVSGNVDNSHFSAFNYGYLYNIDWPANKTQATAIMNRNGSAVAMQWEQDSTASGQWLASALRAGSYLIINGFYFVP